MKNAGLSQVPLSLSVDMERARMFSSEVYLEDTQLSTGRKLC